MFEQWPILRSGHIQAERTEEKEEEKKKTLNREKEYTEIYNANILYAVVNHFQWISSNSQKIGWLILSVNLDTRKFIANANMRIFEYGFQHWS